MKKVFITLKFQICFYFMIFLILYNVFKILYCAILNNNFKKIIRKKENDERS